MEHQIARTGLGILGPGGALGAQQQRLALPAPLEKDPLHGVAVGGDIGHVDHAVDALGLEESARLYPLDQQQGLGAGHELVAGPLGPGRDEQRYPAHGQGQRYRDQKDRA